MVAEWCNTIMQIQVAISPLQAQVQIPLKTIQKNELQLKKFMLHVNLFGPVIYPNYLWELSYHKL